MNDVSSKNSLLPEGDDAAEGASPRMGNRPVPLWIKFMWVLGIAWVLAYIYLGLRSTPVS